MRLPSFVLASVLEEVEGYLKADPFVRAGQLQYEIHPWYGAVGTTLK